MIRKEFIMAKFKVGDKVRILDGRKLGLPWKPNMDSEIGKESIIVQIEEDFFKCETFYFLYGINYSINESYLELAETSMSEEWWRLAKSVYGLCEEIAFNLKPSIIKERNNMNMPNIKDYTYDSKIGLTIIKWFDGTKTVVKSENPDTADQYTGFVTAYAKKAAGNNSKINNLYDKWTVEIPKLKADADKMVEKMKAEETQKEERNRKKREKYIIRKMALQRKREFEARKLASEKYGIPEDEDLT